MLDVLVIGGGFWGSAITQRLRRSGLNVACLDADLEGAASRAAAGLVRHSSWHSPPAPWWEQEHSQACHEFFSQGWVDEYTFNRYQTEPRLKGTVWCGDFPWVETEPARIQRLRPENGGWWAEGWQARQVVLSAGCWCDPILAESGLPLTGVQPWRGSALLARGGIRRVLTRTYRLPGDTRTRTMTARNWGKSQLRLGDSLPDREPEQLAEMRWFLGNLQVTEGEEIWGWRPRLARPLVENWAPGLVVATGGHRNGLALAPAVALRVQQLLQSQQMTAQSSV
ncbi:FAD-binding oxidoreductase [bacterium]|nr:FAD-binding oxidoreductase [bacterium]